MPILGVGVSEILDEVIPTQSPYWLRINGVWLHLDGVRPGSSRSTVRASSDFKSVDGHLYVQQAPRGSREWSLDWEYASPGSVAAIALAAEAPGEVLLFDVASASVNCLAPRDCYGHDPAAPVLDFSGSLPLRAMAAGVSVSTLVRGGAPYSFGVWSSRAVGVEVCALDFPGGTETVLSAGVGLRSTATVIADADGDLEVTMSGTGWAGTGLQLVEGDLPQVWLPGDRTPCPIAVGDPDRVLTLLRSGTTGRSDYTVSLREVG